MRVFFFTNLGLQDVVKDNLVETLELQYELVKHSLQICTGNNSIAETESTLWLVEFNNTYWKVYIECC